MRRTNRLALTTFVATALLCSAATSALADLPAIYPTAVLAFQEKGDDVAGLGGKVTDLLFAELAASPDLFLVDREDMKKILGEQGLSLTGLVNPNEAVQVGQLTGAKLIVTGSVLQVDNSLYLIAKVIGTETSRVVGTKVKGNVRDDLGSLTEDLAEQVSQAVSERSEELVAKVVSRDDRVASLNKQLKKSKRPAVLIEIDERHIGRNTIDPAAETEVTLFCTDTGFEVIDPDTGNKKLADIHITGEGFSEFAARNDELTWVKARLEVKAVDRNTGRVVAIDRQTTVAVDLTEQVAAKTALQNAAADISERLLPKLVEPGGRKGKRNAGKR